MVAGFVVRHAAAPVVVLDAEHGRHLFDHTNELKLEELAAKRLGSIYRPGEPVARKRQQPIH